MGKMKPQTHEKMPMVPEFETTYYLGGMPGDAFYHPVQSNLAAPIEQNTYFRVPAGGPIHVLLLH